VPLSERTPEVAVRPVPQPLRLAPDPTTTVWCADLLVQHEATVDAAADEGRPTIVPSPREVPSNEVPTLFA